MKDKEPHYENEKQSTEKCGQMKSHTEELHDQLSGK